MPLAFHSGDALHARLCHLLRVAVRPERLFIIKLAVLLPLSTLDQLQRCRTEVSLRSRR